jgi:hypothetical protein
MRASGSTARLANIAQKKPPREKCFLAYARRLSSE